MDFVKIKLKHEWMGYPKGMRLELNSRIAEQLINRGTAKAIEKSLDKPTIDKMVVSPERKKRKNKTLTVG